jgi:hypothetical protein
MNKTNMFSTDIPNRFIPGFPYAIRYCPYCERKLEILKAVHLMDQEENYKVVFICHNSECPSYNEEAKDVYIRIYYSSQLAYDILETVMIGYNTI